MTKTAHVGATGCMADGARAGSPRPKIAAALLAGAALAAFAPDAAWADPAAPAAEAAAQPAGPADIVVTAQRREQKL